MDSRERRAGMTNDVDTRSSPGRFTMYHAIAEVAPLALLVQLWVKEYIHFEAGRVWDNMTFVMTPVAYYVVRDSGLLGNVLATVFLFFISGSNPKGSTTANSPKKSFSQVAYGAVVTIRHEDTGGYLHSHALNYETGSRQQRIALHNSTHPTYNFNDWVIQKRDGTVPGQLKYVRDGDYIRLLHVATKRRLHSHPHAAPVTKAENHFEVTGYGNPGSQGNWDDDWRLEVLPQDGKKPQQGGEILLSQRSKFRLAHNNMKCDLFSHSKVIPLVDSHWQEVTCLRGGDYVNTIWTIESNTHSLYPKEPVYSKEPVYPKEPAHPKNPTEPLAAQYMFMGVLILYVATCVLRFTQSNRG